jgi:Transposase DDE domain
MIQQKIQNQLKNILNSFLAGQYTSATTLFDTVARTIDGCNLSENDMSQLSKLLSICFLGQLVDLPTLNRITKYCGISSNNAQKKDTALCNILKNKHLHAFYEGVFEHILTQQLGALLSKHASIFSRELVTVVLDDSVFKMWLSSLMEALDVDKCDFYKQAFSGQMQQVVWGYQVVVLGINIGEVFFPLYFECVRKTVASITEAQTKHAAIVADWKQECTKRTALIAEIKEKKAVSATNEDKKAVKALRISLKVLNISIKELKAKGKLSKPSKKIPEKTAIAVKLMQKAGVFIEKLRKNYPEMADLNFSCDNGYSHKALLDAAPDCHLTYISVPKKGHYFTIDDKKTTLLDYIETVYKPAETIYEAAQKVVSTDKKLPFTMRIRGHYEALGCDVTILIFRLLNSKKVTAIYTPNKNIFAKTLRRHWFARTQIEQFFKMLKHVMQIAETRPREKHGFEYKMLRFAFIALQIKQFIRILRKKRLLPPKAALGTLRIILATQPFIREILYSLF